MQQSGQTAAVHAPRLIGLMGGTFDPIHKGHVALGRQALQEYQLDEVWFMPSHIPPHKSADVSAAEHRSAMVRLAIAGISGLRFSDFELQREGTTYTAQTLKLLKEAYPRDTFFYIIGADSLYEIEKWYHPELILGHITLLAATRSYEKDPALTLDGQITYLTQKYGADIRILHCPRMDIASRDIRRLLQEGGSAEEVVPAAVLAYIREHGLYQKEEL